MTAGWRSTCCPAYSTGRQITIGHADGVITIDLVESLDAYRETLRVRLGEPYRTMLGHFRHEAGHYYQNILVETGRARSYLARCRGLFGDRRTGYADALARHYEFGAPPVWQDSYISGTRPCHPKEDFASCFAITCTSPTHRHRREAGMVLHVDRVRFTGPRDIVPLESYADAPSTGCCSTGSGCRCSLQSGELTAMMGRTRCTPSDR